VKPSHQQVLIGDLKGEGIALSWLLIGPLLAREAEPFAWIIKSVL
jgi:hypothetical protein